MVAAEVVVRKEREVTEENETTPNLKRRKLEEEEKVDVESRIVFSPQASETSVVIVRRRDYSVKEKCHISKRRIEFLDIEKKPVKEAEIEDFFQTVEKDMRKKMLECSRKYNFDFEKDEPFGGRYEWIKLNP